MTKKQIHHIRRVMRMQQGDVIRVADNSGRVPLAEVEYHQKEAAARVVREVRDCSQISVELTLVQGVIKGERWDYLLQENVKLGVAEIIPLVFSRRVVKIKDEKSEKKIVRWNKILCEVCGQCKRLTPVRLQPSCTFSQLPQTDADLRLIAYEDADCRSERLCEVLRVHPSLKRVLMVVGSEGSLSVDEAEALTATGFHRVSLGGRILCVETATIPPLNSIEFYYDMAGEKDEDDI